jgi:hypothetical protein
LGELAQVPDSGLRAEVRSLAAKVDRQEMLAKLGPKLLDALEALGATPRARAVKGGVGGQKGGGGLAAIRSARSA